MSGAGEATATGRDEAVNEPVSRSLPKAARPGVDSELELTIDSMAFGGAGVARNDGYVVFVRGGFPGDRLRARITKAKARFAEARAVEIISEGPDRVPERAPHPGAPWQCLRYERQLEQKQTQVEDALARLGGFTDLQIDPIVEVPEERRWRYRNKLEYSFGNSEDGSLALGFHPPGRWDIVEDVDDVVLASEHANKMRSMVQNWAVSHGLEAHNQRAGTGQLRHLVVREGRRTGQTMVRLVTSPGPLPTEDLIEQLDPELTSLIWTQTDTSANAVTGGKDKVITGKPFIAEELCGLSFRISPDAFFQTNSEQAEVLYGIAREFADLQGHERVYDLYCGSGTIGLTLAVRAAQVWGLEIIPSAIKDAEANARFNEIDNAFFRAGDARLGVRPLVEEAGKPDLVVLDPPRAGLSAKVVRRVLETDAQRIVYVSCNPTTLAPNARQMVDAGYQLKRVRPVDMFPHTPHIECVAVLDRVG